MQKIEKEKQNGSFRHFVKSPSFCDQVFSCKCFHLDSSHRYCTGKCDVEDCICEKFEHGTIELRITVYEKVELFEEKSDYSGGLF